MDVAVSLQDLSALQYSSYAGMIAVVYTVYFIVKRYLDGTYAVGGRFYSTIEKHVRPAPAAFDLWQIGPGTTILFNMFSTSYMAHTNAVKFYNELERRNVSRFTAMVAAAMGFATVLYGVVMVLGFETFGLNSQGLILNNYHVSQDLLATLGRVATAVSIIGAHPLLFSGLRDSFLNIAPTSFTSSRGSWLASTILLLGSATLLSLVAKDVGLIVSLVGSSLGAVLVYVFPALMYIKLLQKRKDIPRSTGESLLLYLTLIFGVVMGIGGTSVTLLSAFTDVFTPK